MKKSVFCLVSIICLCQACNWGQEPDYIPPKLTKAEKQFVRELEKKGYERVELNIPFIGAIAKGKSSYFIDLSCPFDLTEKNKDSIMAVNKEIANRLYATVIEDSIIEDIGEIVVEFSVDHSAIEKYHNILVHKYPKTDLEIWNGFKVIQDEKGTFRRIPWSAEDAENVRRERQRAAERQDERSKEINGIR